MTRSINWHRMVARQQIDSAAAEARSRYLTLADGQEMVYAAKLDQARAYLLAYAVDSGAAVPGYVAAEATVLGDTAAAAAETIVVAAAEFHAGAGPDIEAARRSGKLLIAAAGAVEDIEAAVADAVAALQGI